MRTHMRTHTHTHTYSQTAALMTLNQCSEQLDSIEGQSFNDTSIHSFCLLLPSYAYTQRDAR